MEKLAAIYNGRKNNLAKDIIGSIKGIVAFKFKGLYDYDNDKRLDENDEICGLQECYTEDNEVHDIMISKIDAEGNVEAYDRTDDWDDIPFKKLNDFSLDSLISILSTLEDIDSDKLFLRTREG